MNRFFRNSPVHHISSGDHADWFMSVKQKSEAGRGVDEVGFTSTGTELEDALPSYEEAAKPI